MAVSQEQNQVSSFIFLGAGYTAQNIMCLYPEPEMAGTCRSADKMASIEKLGAKALIFDGQNGSNQLNAEIEKAAYILVSIGPNVDGDPVLNHLTEPLLQAKNLKWLGYLSTVGVYGDHGGEWVDETSATHPISDRSVWRKQAEQSWMKLCKEHQVPVHIFRLPGIYGPSRGPQMKLEKGTARRVEKKGQVFNRAHVEDIATVLKASMQQPNPGAIYNIADDEPAPPQDVLAYAAELMGLDIPPLVPFEEAEMTEMARSFYSDNKRVSNKRIKQELGITLKYPTYREGIKACLNEWRVGKKSDR